jgi:hypothetical protein
VAPLSEGGKLFCVIYGLIGIPLTLILLSAYVERLHRPTMALLNVVHERFSHLYQPFHIRIIHLAAVGSYTMHRSIFIYDPKRKMKFFTNVSVYVTQGCLLPQKDPRFVVVIYLP